MSNDKEKNRGGKDAPTPHLPEPGGSAPALPRQLEDFLDKTQAPPEVKKIISQMSAIQLMGGPAINPIVQKLSPQHIDKLFDYSHEEDQNNYKLESHGRWFNFGYVLLVVVFLVFLVVYLAKDNPILFSDILKILVAFAGGFGSGFGLKTHLEKKK